MKGIINTPEEILENVESAQGLLTESYTATLKEKEIEQVQESIYELRELYKDTKADLIWAFGQMNLLYFQKGNKAKAMLEKYRKEIEVDESK